eukprot:GAHX01001700.1.p1 GENE.GAHX01001700.1~~GAHX01001700.1.p1  ORF type:complete len:885 (-),score=196.29 GAHX01001700.1:31-2685(-)
MLISHFRYSFLCCEYSTNPLAFTVTEIPVCFREPMCMFKTRDENVVCFLAFGSIGPYTLGGPNRRNDSPYSFYFIDTVQKEECFYMGEGDNKTDVISFHVYDDSILTAVQDPGDRHRFKLIGEHKIYEVTFEELFAKNAEIDEEIFKKPREENVPNVPKGPFDFGENPKMANINHLEIADSKTTISEKVVRTVQINNNEHLIIDYTGKVCYFNIETSLTMCLEKDTFKNKTVLDVREVYRDENLIIIWVVLQYDGGRFLKVHRNHVLDSSGHNLNKDFNSKTESKKKLFSLNKVKQMEFIKDINKTVLSKQGNLYQIDEKLVCSNNNMGRALCNGVISSKPVSKARKLYKTYSNFNKTTHIDTTNLNNNNTNKKVKINMGDLNITITKDYKIKLETTNNQIDLLPKERTIKIDGSVNTKLLLTPVSMHVTTSKMDSQIMIYMLDSDNIVYRGVLDEESEEIDFNKLKDSSVDTRNFVGLIASEIIEMNKGLLVSILVTKTVIHTKLIKNDSVVLQEAFLLNDSVGDNQDICTIAKIGDGIIHISFPKADYCLEMSNKNDKFKLKLKEITGLDNEFTTMNKIKEGTCITEHNGAGCDFKFNYCPHLKSIFYYNGALKLKTFVGNAIEGYTYKQEKFNNDSKFNEDFEVSFIKCGEYENIHLVVLGFVERTERETSFSLMGNNRNEKKKSSAGVLVALFRYFDGNKQVTETQITKLPDNPRDAVFANEDTLVCIVGTGLQLFKIDGPKLVKQKHQIGESDYKKLFNVGLSFMACSDQREETVFYHINNDRMVEEKEIWHEAFFSTACVLNDKMFMVVTQEEGNLREKFFFEDEDDEESDNQMWVYGRRGELLNKIMLKYKTKAIFVKRGKVCGVYANGDTFKIKNN